MEPGGTIPPSKAGQRLEASLASGRATQGRSVDSELAGRLLSPETKVIVVADAVLGAEGSTEASNGLTPRHHRGRRTRHVGNEAPLEPGRPCRSPSRERDSAKIPAQERYCQAKDNEARQEKRQGVGAPHSTEEAGEPTRGTPWREGGAGSRNFRRERWSRPQARQPSQRNKRK